MIATSNTSKSGITNSGNTNNSNQEWNNVGNSIGNIQNSHFNGSNSSNTNAASNNNNNTTANPSTGGYGSKFEFDHWVRIPLEPIRAACLRYAKTFSKVEQAMGNRVFFQFDSEGIILRAQDKTTLAAAQKQFLQLSRINQIELLTSGIDQEDYRQVIIRDIKTQGKYGKCFVQLIPYDAFRGIAMQLKNFGYEEPLRQYEKYMKLYPKFAFLLCHEAYFAAVKQELLRMLKGNNGQSSTSGQSQYKEKGSNSVQYVKKEESKEAKEKSAIKKWEELADEGKFSDKEQNGYDDDEEKDEEEIKAKENGNDEQEEDSDEESNLQKASYKQEWEHEQQRIQEHSKMSKEEKEDNFSGLLLELSKTISSHGKEDEFLNNGTNESATSISNNLENPCEIEIIIQDCHRVNVHGLCIAWLLLSKKIAEEQLNIRVDKQSNVILEGIDRQFAYELSSLGFIGADSSNPIEIIKNNDQLSNLHPGICLLIVPSSEISDCIQTISNENLKRACQSDFMVFMKNYPTQNSFFVLFQENLQQQALLQPSEQKQMQSPNKPIEPPKQAEYYSTYPSFNIKECRLIESINKSQTAFLVAFRKQLFCLKILLRLSDRQLHGTLANFEEHVQSENQQLLQIYAVSVHHATSKQFGTAQSTSNQGCNSQNGSSNSSEQLTKLQQLSKITQQSMQQQQQFTLQTQMQQQKQQEQHSSKYLQEPQGQSQQIQQPEQYWDVFVLSEWKSMNLKQAIDSKKYFKTFSQTIAVALQLAIAVKNLHDKQVHHGNLKLTNVLFDGDFNVILSDIAQEPKSHTPSQLKGNIEKQQQNQQSQQASSSQIYQAPELLKGGGGVGGESQLPRSDTRSDIWSLGLLFDDIFQAFPYFSKAEQSAKKKNKKAFGSAAGADYSQKSIAEVKVLISKCHAKNPFARPHISEVLQELKDISKSIKE